MKKCMLLPSRITPVHQTKKHECLKTVKLGDLKTHIICKFQAILVIFLSVGMIEFNHLSYEKAHVNSKQNYTGS